MTAGADRPLLRYASRMSEQPVPTLRRTRATAAFERRFANALGDHLADGTTLLVACSGGPDSTAALVAAWRVAPGAGARVVAGHFNHRTRPDAETEADRAYLETLTGCLGVPLVSGAAPGDAGSAEAEAREARYRWLASAAAETGAAACITGHTLDDQAETVLLRLARGTGLGGAAGMAADASWPVEGEAHCGTLPRLLRPLLDVERAEVLAYLDALGLGAAGLAPRRDPSNDTLAFSRNRVRHRVMPELRELNPRVREALVRFAGHARRDDMALEEWAGREAAGLMGVEGQAARIERRALGELPEAVALRVVRRAAEAVGLGVDGEQAAAVLGIAGRRGAHLDLRGGVASTDGEALWIAADRQDGPGGRT